MIVKQPLRRLSTNRAGYAWALAMVAAATGCGVVAQDYLSLANIALIYLLPVLLVSGRWGLAPGLFASALGALSFNFFLLPPRFTLRVARPDNLVTMAVLFTVAVVVSELASRLRHQVRIAEDASQRGALLSDFSGRLATADCTEAVADMLTDTLSATLSSDAHFLHVHGAQLDPSGLSGIDFAAAQWSIDNAQRTGRGTPIMAAAEWMYSPLTFEGGVRALVALARPYGTLPLAPDDESLLSDLLERSEQALARIDLTAERRTIERQRQQDRLREALLSSVGHDLRTPLTTILGGLRSLSVAIEDRSMLTMLIDQASRLERMIANLLEMTKIEAGALVPRFEPTDLTDAIAAAVEAAEPRRGNRVVEIDIAPDLPLTQTDDRLLHHMLINLVDNAFKFGGPTGVVTITAMPIDGGGIRLTVTDAGPGIDPASGETIFTRFTRILGDDSSGGSGLGLAIVRGFGDALGIATRAANNPEWGASFTLDFPAALVIHAPKDVQPD